MFDLLLSKPCNQWYSGNLPKCLGCFGSLMATDDFWIAPTWLQEAAMPRPEIMDSTSAGSKSCPKWDRLGTGSGTWDRSTCNKVCSAACNELPMRLSSQPMTRGKTVGRPCAHLNFTALSLLGLCCS